jgi:hypothetical protein
VRVEVRQGKGVDDGFFEFFDDGVETTNVYPQLAQPRCNCVPLGIDGLLCFQHTLERDGDLLGRNDLHGDGLLIRVEIQLLYPGPSASRFGIVIAVVVSRRATPPLPRQYSAEFAGRRGGFGACLLLLRGFGIKTGEQVADNEVCYQRLCRC